MACCNVGRNFDAKITPIVVTLGFMAATRGLLLGYGVGVSRLAFGKIMLNLAMKMIESCGAAVGIPEQAISTIRIVHYFIHMLGRIKH
ncbi:hypothetical protein K1719_015144 [Acacia pycnantha]|nr:hypothetical protein K1719_015144 [Acacia pycnantha]